MTLGACLVILSTTAFLFTHSFPLLAVLRVAQGLGFSAFFVANYLHVIDLVPVERRGWALGIYGVSGFLGTALAPVAGEIIVNRLGFHWLFGLSAILGGIGSLMGSLWGGVILGVIEGVGSIFLPTAFRDAYGLAVLVAILLFRPSGLFGDE